MTTTETGPRPVPGQSPEQGQTPEQATEWAQLGEAPTLPLDDLDHKGSSQSLFAELPNYDTRPVQPVRPTPLTVARRSFKDKAQALNAQPVAPLSPTEISKVDTLEFSPIDAVEATEPAPVTRGRHRAPAVEAAPVRSETDAQTVIVEAPASLQAELAQTGHDEAEWGTWTNAQKRSVLAGHYRRLATTVKESTGTEPVVAPEALKQELITHLVENDDPGEDKEPTTLLDVYYSGTEGQKRRVVYGHYMRLAEAQDKKLVEERKLVAPAGLLAELEANPDYAGKWDSFKPNHQQAILNGYNQRLAAQNESAADDDSEASEEPATVETVESTTEVVVEPAEEATEASEEAVVEEVTDESGEEPAEATEEPAAPKVSGRRRADTDAKALTVRSAVAKKARNLIDKLDPAEPTKTTDGPRHRTTLKDRVKAGKERAKAGFEKRVTTARAAGRAALAKQVENHPKIVNAAEKTKSNAIKTSEAVRNRENYTRIGGMVVKTAQKPGTVVKGELAYARDDISDTFLAGRIKIAEARANKETPQERLERLSAKKAERQARTQ